MKMSDVLEMPLSKVSGGIMPFVKEADNDTVAVCDDRHADAIVHAINCHDDMVNALDLVIKSNEGGFAVPAALLAAKAVLAKAKKT